MKDKPVWEKKRPKSLGKPKELSPNQKKSREGFCPENRNKIPIACREHGWR